MQTYDEFIQNILNTRGRFSCGEEYHECHHIIPKCINGGDEKKNLIDLYAREHFIAHKLLAQENPGDLKLKNAYVCMAFCKNDYEKRYELTPEEYEVARKEASACFKAKWEDEEFKERARINSTGENNPMYGISPKERMDEKTYEHWLEQTRERVTSEEFREFMRQINIGKKYSDETNAKKGRKGKDHSKISPVDQYSKDRVFIKRWDYAKLAADILGISQGNIIACCRGTNGRKTAGGFIWKYASDNEEVELCVS